MSFFTDYLQENLSDTVFRKEWNESEEAYIEAREAILNANKRGSLDKQNLKNE